LAIPRPLSEDTASGPDRSFLSDGGEMGALLRARNWRESPIGPPEAWPQALQTAIQVMLTTQHPVFIFWGPQHLCFYNDAYRRSIGDEKHPAIVGRPGREAWPEIWDIIGPQIEHVMDGRGATWHENQLVPILRHGAIQDVYWTYSYGPIRDATAPNRIGGVLVLCSETTAQVQSERRLRESDERLRLALDVAALRVWEMDVDSEQVVPAGNGADARESAPIPLEHMLRNLHPADAPRVGERLRAAAAGHAPFDEEFRVQASDGELVLHSRANLVHTASGQRKLIGVIEDVTVARRTAAELAAVRHKIEQLAVFERDKLIRLFHRVPGFIAILSGAEHRFEFVNEAYRRLFGERSAEGRTVREVFPELAGQGIYETLDQVYRTGERFIARDLPVAIALPGESPQEMFLDFTYEAMRDESGAIVGVFCEGYDVTARRRAERE